MSYTDAARRDVSGTFTVISDNKGILTKKFSIGQDGRLERETVAHVVDANARMVAASPHQLAQLLNGGLQANEALAFGVPDAENARIVTERQRRKRGEAGADEAGLPIISRSRRYFKWSGGAGYLMCDVDPIGDEILSQETVFGLITAIIPELAKAPCVSTHSASSWIFDSDTGDELIGARGLRFYWLLDDTSEVPRIGKLLQDRLWLAGYGRVVLSASGAMLLRTPLDGAVSQPERLDFAAGAVCGPGIEQRRPAPIVINGDAPPLDTSSVQDLNTSEQSKLLEVIGSAKDAMRPAASAKRAEWIEKRLDDLVRNISETDPALRQEQIEAERKKLGEMLDGGFLADDFILHIVKGGEIVPTTVSDVLANRVQYHHKLTLDPIEPGYLNGKVVGRLDLLNADGPILHSFAHGGAVYRLRSVSSALLVIDLWDESIPVSGTLGEAYLSRTLALGIREWPEELRYHQKSNALIARISDLYGEMIGVHAVYLDGDGKPRRHAPKKNFGPSDGGFFRIGDNEYDYGENLAPLIICEDIENALTLWTATHGMEVWATITPLEDLKNLPLGRQIILAADNNKRSSPSARKLNLKVRRWEAEGLDVTTIYAGEVRGEGVNDFSDLNMDQGLHATRARAKTEISGGWTAPYWDMPIGFARVALAALTTDFFTRALSSRRFTRAIGVTLGAGKTYAAHQAIIRFLHRLRDDGSEGMVVFGVPNHKLSDEVADRFNRAAIADREARGGSHLLTAAVWRGRDARRPGGGPEDLMCSRIDDVRAAQEIKADVSEEVCGACPHLTTCPYIAQYDIECDVLVVSHALIGHAMPPILKRRGLAAAVIDEDPLDAWLVGLGDEPTELPLGCLVDGSMPPGDEPALPHLRRRLHRALETAPDGPVTLEQVTEAGITFYAALDALRLEWDRKIVGAAHDRGPNATIDRAVMLWEAIAELAKAALLAFNRPIPTVGSGWAELVTTPNGRVIRLLGRRDIRGSKWGNSPFLFLDAGIDEQILRHWFPDLPKAMRINVEAWYQRIHQLAAYASSKSYYLDESGNTPAELRTKARRRAKLRAWILAVSRACGGRAAVCSNKRIITALDLPDDIGKCWFNAVAGLDEFGDTDTMVIVGRTQPAPRAIERQSMALTGWAPAISVNEYQRKDAWRAQWGDTSEEVRYTRTDNDHHPDPLCERLRRRAAYGQVKQALGRPRGVNRTKDNPVDIFILSDVVLDEPVDRLLTIAALELDGLTLQLGQGPVAFHSADAAHRAYPGLFGSRKEARTALDKIEKVGATSGPFLAKNTKPEKGLSSHSPFSFHLTGVGQIIQSGVYDPRRLEPGDVRAEVERLLGTLAEFWLGDSRGQPTELERQLEVGPVAFQSPAAALKAYPTLWASKDAAKKAFAANRGDQPSDTLEITFKIAGNGQRPQRAYVRSIGGAQELVESLIGLAVTVL